MQKSLIDIISEDLYLDKQMTTTIINQSDKLYRCFTIPKRNGKKRYIFQPSLELKALQYWVIRMVLNKLKVSDSAQAYKSSHSIKTNANLHINAKHVFHTDINDFFPSINGDMLKTVLINSKNLFIKEDIWCDDFCDVIIKICFKKNRLCIGAPSSPFISNIVMFNFDNEIQSYCKENDYVYTRYADDIYISSTDYINDELKKYISNRLIKYGFSMNRNKTSFTSYKNNIRVTGINIINNNSISIGNKSKRKIRSMVYNYLKNNKGDGRRMMGYLSFLRDVEPLSYNKLITKYSTYTSKNIIDELKKSH